VVFFIFLLPKPVTQTQSLRRSRAPLGLEATRPDPDPPRFYLNVETAPVRMHSAWHARVCA
jgi:hypothetical protein